MEAAALPGRFGAFGGSLKRRALNYRQRPRNYSTRNPFRRHTRSVTLQHVRRKLIFAGLTAALIAVLVIGLVSARKSDPAGGTRTPASLPLAQAKEQLRGSPAPLAALHRQSAKLLGGGSAAFVARLRSLRGYPVVVNKWGSWCPPCRAEFPHFQREAAKHGTKIAFLGVDGQDVDSSARKFLANYPVSYPSYIDGNLKIAKYLQAVNAFPSTVFYDRTGGVAYIRQGSYADERSLASDIRRYAR